jgi:hemerythrin-like domain-containing protein
LSQHQTEGYSGLEVLAGRLRIVANGERHEVATGDVIVMAPAVPHQVEAIADASFLLTIAMPSPPAKDMGPVAMLEAEHDAIRIVVGVMAVLAERLELDQDVPTQALHELVEFMRLFGDRCHHGKEEQVLFPMLEQKGVPIQGCPLGVLVHEHERGRALVTELEQASLAYAEGQADGLDRLRKSLQGLTALYPGHMWREEYLLFPMAKKILSAEEMDAVQERFDRVEAELGAGVHEHLHQLAARLGRQIEAS